MKEGTKPRGIEASRRGHGALSIVILLFLSLIPSRPAVAQPTVTDAKRGVASSIDIEYLGGKLRAKADQTPGSAVLVRVLPIAGSTKQRIEFLGTIAGTYDLRDFLEREDGRSIADLPAIGVRVVSQLPANHGEDVLGLHEPAFSLSSYYREMLIAAGVIWAAVPVVVLVRRAMRKPPPVAPVAAAPPPDLGQQLAAMLTLTRERSLSVAERGRLELLLFQYSAGRLDAAGELGPHGGDPATTISLLREHPRTRDVVLAVERWLHRRDGGAAGAVPRAEFDAMMKEFLAGQRDEERKRKEGEVAGVGAGGTPAPRDPEGRGPEIRP